jgi:hypothetical protein
VVVEVAAPPCGAGILFQRENEKEKESSCGKDKC